MANHPQLDPSRSAKLAGDGEATPAGGGARLPSFSGGRVVGVVDCPHCGASVNAGASVCPECGEPLQTQPKRIRCRRCGGRASSLLVLCPHCGRELHPAPSRLLTLGAPALLVGLFFLVMVGTWGQGNPVQWVQTSLTDGVDWLETFGAQMEPSVVIEMTPIVQPQETVVTAVARADGEVPPSPTMAEVAAQNQPVAALQAPAGETEATPTPLPAVAAPTIDVSPTAAPPTAEPPTAVPTASPTPQPTATPTPTGTPTSTATRAPTATPTAQPTTPSAAASTGGLVILPTATPTPQAPAAAAVQAASVATAPPLPTPTPIPATATSTPTATPALPRTYRVQAGDTLVGIAARLGVTVEALMRANNIASSDVYRIQPGQELVIPGSGADTPTATPALPRTYRVQAGDTLVGIAARLGVTVEALMRANNIASSDVYRIQPGQELVIPGGGADTPTATPQPPTATPTTRPPATPAPTATQVAYRLDPPLLRSPEDGTPVSCGAQDSLVWIGVPFIQPTDRYLLHLGFVSGYTADGQEVVTWVLEQPRPYNLTSWEMDEALCGLAPQQYGRQWRWWVEVVAEEGSGYRPVSPPSEVWGFSWQ
ncbi:LysM peptidoglycan-binding domain-containing protein [Litorilinea aerophila]|uniref:LysM peptidoglycan-binding domain-containing protein n=1 Tax=Litorilinea aerophila TaxID=1204385 RepID=A0A540VIS4_9CHLR|nr:zinc ribbon domain-containing protein [Litorilinea aerophila]MCC9075883.1 LysM peptidoglycan-binding domain-containing protein [Litorilinea aerophila]